MIDTIIGTMGLCLGLFVAPVQLIRIIKTKQIDGISLMTYVFLEGALVCYLVHAIFLNDPIFIIAQSVNLVTNLAILILLIKHRR